MVFKNKKVPKLKHLLIKPIYYKLLNTSYIFNYNWWKYCRCDQFQGCRLIPRFWPNNSLEKGDQNYCYICRIGVTYHSGKIENITKIADIIKNCIELKNDIQLCIDFDPSCKWMYHYRKSVGYKFSSRWRNLKDDFDTSKVLLNNEWN